MKKMLIVCSIVFATQQVIAGALASDTAESVVKQASDRNQSIAQQICWQSGVGCEK